jgi:hypothetical protein
MRRCSDFDVREEETEAMQGYRKAFGRGVALTMRIFE